MTVLLIIVIALAITFLFFNLFSRQRLLRSFKHLQKGNVEFEIRHIFNKELREKEVHPRYPEQHEQIETFCRQIRESLKYAGLIFLVLAALGWFIIEFS